jgi:hypothetical protein
MPGKKGGTQKITRDYDALLSSVIDLLETGRQIAARSVNAVLTMTYWQVGQRLVEHEQAVRRGRTMGSDCSSVCRGTCRRGSVVVSRRETLSKCASSIGSRRFADAVCEFRASESAPDSADSVCEIRGKNSVPAVPAVLVSLRTADSNRGCRAALNDRT